MRLLAPLQPPNQSLRSVVCNGFLRAVVVRCTLGLDNGGNAAGQNGFASHFTTLAARLLSSFS